MQQIELAALRTFISVVEAGGFSRAADTLESTTAAVRRRVAALGKRLGGARLTIYQSRPLAL
jgi:DNA-binding transcriptional LysR family regulator